MIKSMTGYGGAKGIAAGFEVSVELKSVNNKFLETNVRIPRNFIFAEEALKSRVQSHISRGKVDLFVNIGFSEVDDVSVKVNESLVRSYLDAIGKIAQEQSIPNDVTAMSIARLPDVLTVERNELDAVEVTSAIESVLEEALTDFDRMREIEGGKLREDVLGRLQTISEYVSEIEKKAPETVKAYSEKMRQKLEEILGTSGIDETRIITETAIFADHICTDEETVRLRSHMAQLETMINGNSPIGRKIDFLIQEFNREANTIGSKCQNSEIAHVVVDLKAEIEKIREQIQNIE